MNVREIVKQHLVEHGYDGLFNEECGCELTDLMPCDELSVAKCEPGYKRCADPETGWDFVIGPEKEKANVSNEN